MDKARSLAVASLLMSLAWGSAKATLITEDFQVDGNPGVPGFDPLFDHNVDRDEFGRNEGVNSSFTTSRFVSPGHSLFIGSGTDYITFNLDPGEYVDYAEVWLTSFQSNPPAYFHAIGTQGELIIEVQGTFSSPLERVDTAAANLGEIVEIRLTGFEGYFDNLGINVVPEPGTVFLFMVAGLVMAARRNKPHVVMSLALLLFFCASNPIIGRSNLPRWGVALGRAPV